MRYELKVPQQGETTEYVTITGWSVAVGDTVKEGQEIGEMESAKATSPIECLFNGMVVELCKAEGDEADIGETIAVIEG